MKKSSRRGSRNNWPLAALFFPRSLRRSLLGLVINPPSLRWHEQVSRWASREVVLNRAPLLGSSHLCAEDGMDEG